VAADAHVVPSGCAIVVGFRGSRSVFSDAAS
jgi:hypothetical protein